MKSTTLFQKLQIDKKELVTSAELKQYCKKGGFDYDLAIKSLVRGRRLVRVFRGIYYVRAPDEIVLGKSRYSHLELVARGLDLKNVENWYYGLYTALKLNNMTHETFVVSDVINDSIFRQNPMKIGDHRFKFTKISKKLTGFGIRRGGGGKIRYSDPEKTILDFIYLWRQNGRSSKRIVSDVIDWSQKISEKRMKKYLKNYPKTTKETACEVLHERESD